MKAVLLEHIGLLLISLALVMPTVLTVLHFISTHSASSQLKKSNDIVRNLDFTTHLNFKNQTNIYVDICVYIFSTECVVVNRIFKGLG